MKYSINLASQPFRRYRAMFVASAAVCVLLVFTLGALISMILADRAQMADVRADILRLNNEIRKVTNEQAKVAATMRRPENAEVFERSIFINTLLMRKSISWTKIFADLEKTVPYNVKIVQVHPTLDSQNHISLDMMLAANTQLAIFDFLKAFSEAPIFGDVELISNDVPKQSEPMFRARVRVPYAQKL
jgi:type IV pilus assembly protein PilN